MLNSHRLALLAGAVFATGAHALPGQAAPSRFRFTIDNIMRGPELYGREPQGIRWSSDGKWIYFNWLEPGASWREPTRPFRVRAVPGSKPERITTAEMDSATVVLTPGRLSADRKWRAVSALGDLYLVDVASGEPRRLTETSDAETDPSFSADGKDLYFVRDGNVFSLTLDGGLTRQITNIRSAGASAADAVAAGRGGRGGRGGGRQGGGGEPQTARQGGSGAATGQRAELRDEQRTLLEAVRDKLWQDSVAAAERTRSPSTPRAFTLLANERVANLSVSPNGKALIMVTTIEADGAQNTIVPNYITASGYTEEISGRTKVGDAQNGGRLLYMSLPDGAIKPLNAAPEDAGGASSQAGAVGWNDDGTLALVMANTRDFKRRYLSTVNESGDVHVVDMLSDTAWVGGPCSRCAGWFDGGKRIYFVSEADGFAHLYTIAADGSDRQQLTKGQWEVTGVELSHDETTFYLHSSEGSPFEQHFYRMAVTGGARTRITSKVGGHNVTVSPDESMLADVYSESNRPPELFIMQNRPGAEMSRLTLSPSAEFLSFNWIKPAIIKVPASDGVQVPTRIYRPKDMGAQPNGAAVIFVHGAGYLHNVHYYWTSSYAREYMFNQFLASKGFVVIDMDYRASAGYGRDWRTAIYRWMGGRDLQDEVDGSKYLKATFGIEPKRVGIYGGSYGGFMTLMALFTAPDYFGAGAALRSVTNWANYNHGYTGAILNMPDKDTLAYHRSSPIYFAQGLRAPLLMAHGMVDTNVNFQDIVELTERLIELGKKNWTLAPYPVENHGFVRPSSWADEYNRVYDLFDRVLVKPYAHGSTVGTGK